MLAEILSETGIIVVALVIVVLFGSTQLPKLARSLGSAQAEFKKGVAEGQKSEDAEKKGSTEHTSSNSQQPADTKKE